MIRVSPQRSLQIGTNQFYGIDPSSDFTVIPWLSESRGIDFQDGQIILGSQVKGRIGDHMTFANTNFQVYGRLMDTGIRSLESGLFTTLHDLSVIQTPTHSSTMGINGLLINNLNDQPLEQIKFTLLANISDIQAYGGRGLLTLIRASSMQLQRLLIAIGICLLICIGVLFALFYAGIAFERQKELGILLTLGAFPYQLILVFVSEALVLCSVGVLIGFSLTLISVAPLKFYFSSQFIHAQLPLYWPSIGKMVVITCFSALSISITAVVSAYIAITNLVVKDPFDLIRLDA